MEKSLPLPHALTAPVAGARIDAHMKPGALANVTLRTAFIRYGNELKPLNRSCCPVDGMICTECGTAFDGNSFAIYSRIAAVTGLTLNRSGSQKR